MFACIFNAILMFALLYSDNITFCRPLRNENSIATLLTSRAQRTCARRPLFPSFSEDHLKTDFSSSPETTVLFTCLQASGRVLL